MATTTRVGGGGWTIPRVKSHGRDDNGAEKNKGPAVSALETTHTL
jgi:hypothetical protein